MKEESQPTQVFDVIIKTPKLKSIGVFFSLMIHLFAFSISYFLSQKAYEEKIQHVRFIPPPPILKKSFDLAKRPEISEVQMQMLMESTPDVQPSLEPTALADISLLGTDLLSVVTPIAGGGGGESLGKLVGSISGTKPAEIASQTTGLVQLSQVARPAQQSLSLKTELMNTKALDTGRYQSIIIQDVANKRNVRGFFNMTLIRYDFQNLVDPAKYDEYPLSAQNMVMFMNDATKIRTEIRGQKIKLSDPRLFKAPFIMMTGYQSLVQLTPTEIANLGEYLRNGGFLFIDCIGIPGTDTARPGHPFEQQMKAYLRQALGAEAKFFRIPKSHPLFHSFYDFGDGPPLGGARSGIIRDLEGVEIRGRLAVLFSNLNLTWYWGSDGAKDPQTGGRTPGLTFGVNVIVFALTQPGGIANVSQFTQ